MYYQHFGLVIEADIVWDEYEWIVHSRMVEAVNIHHIEHGANKYDHIKNLMALSYENHTKAHNEEFSRQFLKALHANFISGNHPY